MGIRANMEFFHDSLSFPNAERTFLQRKSATVCSYLRPSITPLYPLTCPYTLLPTLINLFQ
jgi:hypothetical protein